MEQKKFYITTSIPYANARPHVGHAYELVLADIIARYHRSKIDDTFFLTGTAEHGEKIIRAAKKENIGPQAFVDKNVKSFVDLYEKLTISYDSFIRNSDKERHWPGAQALWTKLLESGDIYKKVYEGLYCVGCEKFITEKELVGGKCADHDTEPEKVEEENYFFRLSKYQDRIIEILEKQEIKIIPASRVNELLAFTRAGLEDISFSRPEGPILWGIPVPNDKTHMMYVWCEELSNYISALGYGREDHSLFDKFWPADVHVIGKDISRFHAIVWPAMLLSAGLPFPKSILIHGHITSGGKKMSKTVGNVIDPEEYVLKYGVDALRYYFAREIVSTDDGDFTEEHFIETYNANLANGIGNLMSRTLKMAEQYFDGEVSRGSDADVALKRSMTGLESEIVGEGFSIPYIIDTEILPQYHKAMERLEINKATDVLWSLIGRLDGYITDYEPFKLIKTNKNKTENIIWNLLYGLHNITELLSPILPSTAEIMHKHIKKTVDGEDIKFSISLLDEPLFLRK